MSLEDLDAGTTLESFAASNIEGLETLEGFESIDRFLSQTANDVPTETILFSWNSEGTFVPQVQIYAVVSSTGYRLTFTPGTDDVRDYPSIARGLIESFAVIGFPGDSNTDAEGANPSLG